jgi:formylmethanofuran--tetrahydromethanopterin N-formyltransferase
LAAAGDAIMMGRENAYYQLSLFERSGVELNGTQIEDTFAEAFRMRYVRLVVTAHDEHWLDAAVREFTGYSSSIISCDSEAGRERLLTPHETPDGRPGAAILVFGFSAEGLAAVVPNRLGQCVMTCPTTAVYDGLSVGEKRIPLGKTIRYFGDGFQKSKLIGGRRFWRLPVMDGEFVVEHTVHVEKGIGGGNFILQGASQVEALAAARRAIEAINPLAGVITPFPGGVARSGSKVGSRYKALKASTADAYCPTLRGRVETKLIAGANAAYEIVIDGAHEAAIAAAMAAGIRAAAGPGILGITAGNYGGKLGKFHFQLREVLA